MELGVPRRRASQLVVAVLVAASVAVTAGCARYTPSYDQNDHVNDGLVRAILSFAGNLSDGRGGAILFNQTVPAFQAEMRHFLTGHLGRPTAVVRVKPAGDQVVSARLDIKCRADKLQHVYVLWSWRDGGWRAWPGWIVDASGAVHNYPACR